MSNSEHEKNNTIFYEMMSHPALFTHAHPKKVIILGDEDSAILREIIKHDHLTDITVINKSGCSISNTKVKAYSEDTAAWTKEIAPHSVDILFHAAPPTKELLKTFFTLLGTDGILIQQSASPFEMASVNSLADQLRLAGFNNQQILHFPQPGFSLGWRSIIMASKQGIFKRVREQAVYAKPFKTYYYNLDTHKASLVLPEFMREEWVI